METIRATLCLVTVFHCKPELPMECGQPALLKSIHLPVRIQPFFVVGLTPETLSLLGGGHIPGSINIGFAKQTAN